MGSEQHEENENEADAVFQRVSDDWIRKSGVHGVGVGGDRSDRIIVTIDFKRAEVREQFPDAIEGVPVEIRFTDPDKEELL
jgi:hypothetical protein